MAGGAGGSLLAAGELRERVVFLTSTRTDDRGFASETFSTVAAVWAAVRLQGGSNENTQDRRAAKLAIQLDLRYRSDITDEMRIVWRGKTFEIVAPIQIVPIEGRMAISALEDESLSLAVDHLTVSPASIYLLSGDTLQATATCFDDGGNVVPAFVLWSTSDPTIATVDITTGLVTGVALGTCTITATSEGKTATATAIVTLPLTLTLDWSPLVRATDLADPLTLVSNTGRTGYQDGVPQHTGSGILNSTNSPARATYPKSATEWGSVALVDGPMSADRVPDATHCTTNTLIDGPYPNTGARSLVPNDANQHYAILDNSWNALAAADNQDAATFKRSLGCVLMAASPADVGKSVRVNLIDSNNYPAGGNWSGAVPVIKFVDVVLAHSLAEIDHTAATALLWQHVALTFDSQAQQSAIVGQPLLAVTMTPGTPTQLASYAVAPYQARAWQAVDATPENYLRPVPFHPELGVFSTDIYCNTIPGDSDAPGLLGSTVRAVTTVPAPDSKAYHGGRFYSRYTMAQGDALDLGIVRIEDGGNFPPALSNIPVGSAWGHFQVKPDTGQPLPLDTDVGLTLDAIGAVATDEDTVQRPDNFGNIGSMDTGQAWVVSSGTWEIFANTIRLGTNVTDDFIYVDSGLSDCTVVATLFAVGNDGSVVARITNANNRWRLLWESGVLRLDKIVAGVLTTVASTAVAINPGDTIGLVLSGNTLSPQHNGITVGALVVTDAFNATATKHGLGAFNNGPRYSHFKVSTIGVAHSYGPFLLQRDSTRYGLAFGSALVGIDGEQVFRTRPTFNLAAEGYLDFHAKIVKVSPGSMTFLGYRTAVTTEGARGLGLHSAWAPKRTITGRQFCESCFETIPNIQTIMTTPTLVWLMRQWVPWSFGDLDDINGAGSNSYRPSLWESGPYGSDDYTFHCDITTNGDGTFSIIIQVQRDIGGFLSWEMRVNNVSIAQAALLWQKFVAFDMAVVAQNGAPVALGIGLGTGTGITWLAHGDAFLGGQVVFSNSAGTAWAFDGGLGTGPGLGHIGIAADLDRVRQTNGGTEALAAGNVVDPIHVRRSIEYQIARKWRDRKDHRLPVAA